MRQSDAEWERLKPLMRAEDQSTFVALRKGYRDGIPRCEPADSQATVARVFQILAEAGGEQLVGKSKSLAEGTFWSGYRLPACPAN